MTLAEMLGRISSRELQMWMAYEAMFGPLGAVRADVNAGIIAATFANCHLKQGAEPLKPSDFMPWFDSDNKAQKKGGRKTVKEMMAALLGAVGRRPGKPIQQEDDQE